MASTEVVTSKMNEVANRLEDIVSKYNTSVSKVYEIGGQIDSMWDGEASNKFVSILGNDREKFNALSTMLQKYIEILRQDVSIYQKAENDVLNVLNSNKVR